MRPDDKKKTILDSVTVSRAEIAAAKAFFIGSAEHDTCTLITKWIAKNGGEYPDPVPLRGTSTADDLRRVARALSLKLAASYAVWELIGAGCLTPAGVIDKETPSVGYSMNIPGSRGGRSDAWQFRKLTFSYPTSIYRPIAAARRGVFTDGDLYLQGLGLADLDPGIEEALREAVQCFRYDLFTGAVAMLGAASEGVWIELGRAIANARPGSSKSQKINNALDTSSRGIGYLVKQIVEMCENRNETGDILKQANVTLPEVRCAFHWWNTIREARNVLHWGVESAFANSFDKVSVLMLSAASHLRTLWKIRTAALRATS